MSLVIRDDDDLTCQELEVVSLAPGAKVKAAAEGHSDRAGCFLTSSPAFSFHIYDSFKYCFYSNLR